MEGKRANAVHQDLGKRFRARKKGFEKQYAHLYNNRYMNIKPYILRAAKNKYDCSDSKPKFLARALDIESNIDSFLIGTLYREMMMRRNIIEEFSDKIGLDLPDVSESMAEEKDIFYIEDDSGRIRIVGPYVDSGSKTLFTGMVVGLRGMSFDAESFTVSEVVYPSFPKQVAITAPESKYVCFVSGLQLGHPKYSMMPAHLLVEMLLGRISAKQESDTRELARKTVKLVVAGNSICPPEETPEGQKLLQQPHLTPQARFELTSPVKALDAWLTQVLTSLPVDIMPGHTDPANVSLPQAPLSSVLLTTSSRFSTLLQATNPHDFSVDGTRFLGTSGQNIQHVLNCMIDGNGLDVAESSLRARHVAPSAPDVIDCYPFESNDPFLINEAPHVFFAGNQGQFAARIIEGDDGQKTLLLMVPQFATTSSAVFVDVKTLECFEVKFDAF